MITESWGWVLWVTGAVVLVGVGGLLGWGGYWGRKYIIGEQRASRWQGVNGVVLAGAVMLLGTVVFGLWFTNNGWERAKLYGNFLEQQHVVDETGDVGFWEYSEVIDGYQWAGVESENLCWVGRWSAASGASENGFVEGSCDLQAIATSETPLRGTSEAPLYPGVYVRGALLALLVGAGMTIFLFGGAEVRGYVARAKQSFQRSFLDRRRSNEMWMNRECSDLADHWHNAVWANWYVTERKVMGSGTRKLVKIAQRLTFSETQERYTSMRAVAVGMMGGTFGAAVTVLLLVTVDTTSWVRTMLMLGVGILITVGSNLVLLPVVEPWIDRDVSGQFRKGVDQIRSLVDPEIGEPDWRGIIWFGGVAEIAGTRSQHRVVSEEHDALVQELERLQEVCRRAVKEIAQYPAEVQEGLNGAGSLAGEASDLIELIDHVDILLGGQ